MASTPKRKPPAPAMLAELERQRDRVRRNISASEERLAGYRRTEAALSAALDYMT